MSSLVWSLPTFGVLTTGYAKRTDVTLGGVFVILLWYSTLYTFLRLGEIIGSSTKFPLGTADTWVESIYGLAIFTSLSAVGVLYTYAKIFSILGIQGAIFYVTSGLANELKLSLYTEYLPGVLSLRYLVVFSASLSIYRYTKTRKIDLWLIANSLSLVMSALIASRLLFVATLLVAAFLIKHGQRYLTLKLTSLVLTGVLLFSALAVLNFTRNSNYYAKNGQGFWTAGVSSIVTYVGAPFQVLLAAANDSDPDFLVKYGSGSDQLIADLDDGLNANSAFVQVHEVYGYGAWLYFPGVCFVAGLLFGICTRAAETLFLLPAGAILYACAEIWRLDLFSQGIFIVWIAFGLAVPLGIILYKHMFDPRSRRGAIRA